MCYYLSTQNKVLDKMQRTEIIVRETEIPGLVIKNLGYDNSQCNFDICPQNKAIKRCPSRNTLAAERRGEIT